jgi:hypothetical protein
VTINAPPLQEQRRELDRRGIRGSLAHLLKNRFYVGGRNRIASATEIAEDIRAKIRCGGTEQ